MFNPELWTVYGKVENGIVVDIVPRIKISEADFTQNDWRLVFDNIDTIDPDRFLVSHDFTLEIYPDKIMKLHTAIPLPATAVARILNIKKG